MHDSKKEELLKFFSISLAMIACSTMIYMLRTPSLTGSVVLEPGTPTTIAVVTVLILAGLAVVLGAIAVVHKLKKELESHKNIITGTGNERVSGSLDLASYVLKAKQKGFNSAQIVSKLKKLGWKEAEIRKYL